MTPTTQVIKITIDQVMDALYDAAKLGDAKEEKLMVDAFVETPHGIDITKVGQEVIDYLLSVIYRYHAIIQIASLFY